MKTFGWRGAFGVGSDHRVEGEECWVLALIEDLIGIIQIGDVSEGNGGDKVAGKVTVVEKTIN